MTLGEMLEKFLQVDHMVCDNDGKQLHWGYLKQPMWPQHPLGSWRWLKQVFGDVQVLRFCDRACYIEFLQKGRAKELRGGQESIDPV